LSFSIGKNLKIKLLAACNSGDTAGGKDRVVGYSSFALHEGVEVSMDEAGRTLLALARESIESSLHGRSPSTAAPAPWLSQSGATFVTLTKNGALRGCIGSLQAAQPLRADVAQNALGAAFRDPRFPPVTAQEWPQVRVEVSLLSSPKPIRFADEADLLAQIVPGEDGLILQCEGRRATFLPQVWESLRDPQVFLGELVKKAGLPAGTRLGRCTVFRYRAAKWKEEA
jgi:AmmeMemoRadiSam system protein A